MLVKFILEESNGDILRENEWQMEINNSEIQILLQSKEIFFPKKDNWGVHCTIQHTIYEMFQEPRFLEVHLKENE